MKLKQKSLKIIALLLSFLVLMQSCAVNAYTYQKTTVEDAVQSGFAYKTRIERYDDKKIVFVKLERVNDTLYGLKNVNNRLTRFPIEENQIKNIYNKRRDDALSKVLTIVVPVAVVAGLAAIVWGNLEIAPDPAKLRDHF